MIQNSNDITYGINSNIIRAFEKVIERNNKESFSSLMYFVRNVLRVSFQNNSLKHFEQYIFIPAIFYNISFEKAKKDSTLIDISRDCSSQSSRNLKDILWLDLSIFGHKASELEAKKMRNPYYYWAFHGFSRLLYFMVRNRDLNSFSFAMKEYEQVSGGAYNGNLSLEFQIEDLKRENINGTNNDKINKLKADYQILDQFNTYHRHVLIGIKYWIIFLYSAKEFTEEMTLAFIDQIKIPPTESKTVFGDTLFFRANSFQRYMGWDDWDNVERHSGISYSPPMVNNWMTLGFFVDQLRGNRIYINLNQIDNEELHQAIFLYEELKGYATYFQENFDRWKSMLKVKSEPELKSKCDELLSIYAVLKRKSIEDKEKAIANTPLSKQRIDEFKDQIGKAWESNAAIHSLFKTRGNAEHITNDEIKLKNVGQRTFFEKAKIMFIESEFYQSIGGIERMGGEIGRWENNGFFALLFKEGYNKETGPKVIEVLEKSLKAFDRKRLQVDMILLAPEFSYTDTEFINDERFVLKTKVKAVGDLGKFHLGYFDTIPLYTSHSDFLKNTILVCNFKSAFKMRYKTSPNWFDQELNVDVKAITNEEALKKLEENPQKWKTTEEGIVLSDEDALIMIKTSVMIDIWSTIDFHVLNKDAFIIGSIEPKK